jgi:predicted unusual protein kinase regulating ubiquinone biosynthesis (AarF/ABC1/UbiB family)
LFLKRRKKGKMGLKSNVELRVTPFFSNLPGQAFDKLHTRYAPVAKYMCLRLRGFYLKQAQLMSTLDDFIPPQYLEWCKTMQDQVFFFAS